MAGFRSTFAKIFFSPETIVTFLFGSLALSVAGNALYDLLKKATGEGIPSYSGILIGSITILLLSAWIVARIIASRQRVEVEPLGQAPAPCRGLIVLVTREEPCREALKPHLGTLQHLWLVCSAQSLAAASTIQHEFAGQVATIHEPKILNDLYSPREGFDLVRSILDKLPDGLAPEDVACDYTGLTAHASIGMAIAALNGDAPLQYIPARLDENLKVTGSLPAMKVRLSLVRRRK